MRRILLLFPILLLLGCDPGWEWRDEHRGVLKSVSGYSTLLVVEFQDGKTFKIPMLSDSDPWAIGQECVLQSRKPSGSSIAWRFASPKFQPEPRPPAENVITSPSPSG